jgi:predicted  nucleic acid-binding Zn-ribbon protein
MALFDKVKEQASQLAQKAQEAGKAGQAKIEDAQAKRKSDAMLRDLGAALYAQKTTGADNSAEIDRIVGELTAFEAEHGPVAADDTPDAGGASPSGGTSGEAETPPEGGFKL